MLEQIEKLINKCKNYGVNYAEASVQNTILTKFAINKKTFIDEIETNLVFFRCIYSSNVYNIVFTCNEKNLDILTIFEYLLRYPSSHNEKKIIPEYTFNIIEKTAFEPLKLNDIKEWVHKEIIDLEDNISYKINSLDLILQRSKTYYVNSLGSIGQYSCETSYGFGAIDMKLTLDTPDYFFFNLNKPEPFKKLFEFEMLNKISDYTNYKQIVVPIPNLNGKIKLTRNFLSKLMPLLSSFFMIDSISQGTSFFSNNQNVVLDSKVNIIDSPLQKDGYTYFPFDIEGSKAVEKYLFKNGRLHSFLSDRQHGSIEQAEHGNLNWVLNTHHYKIMPSNTMLIIDNNSHNDLATSLSSNVDITLIDFAHGSGLNPSSATLFGQALGLTSDGVMQKFLLNLNVFDFELAQEEMHSIDRLNRNFRYCDASWSEFDY